MAIRVKYAPRADLGAALALAAGEGEFQQKKDVFDRGIEEFDARLANERQTRDMQQRFNYDRLREQQRQADLQLADRQQSRMANMFNSQQAREFALLQNRENSQMQWQANVAKAMDADATKVLSQVSALTLNPAGEEVAAEQMRKYRAITRQRPNMLPQTYARAIGQWMDETQNTGILDGTFDKPEPTAEDRFRSKRYVDKNEDVWLEDHNGDWSKEKPDKPLEGPAEFTAKDQAAHRIEVMRQEATAAKEKAAAKLDRAKAVTELARNLMADAKMGDTILSGREALKQAKDMYDELLDEPQEPAAAETGPPITPSEAADAIAAEEAEAEANPVASREQAREARVIEQPVDLLEVPPGELFWWKDKLFRADGDGKFTEVQMEPIRVIESEEETMPFPATGAML